MADCKKKWSNEDFSEFQSPAGLVPQSSGLFLFSVGFVMG